MLAIGSRVQLSHLLTRTVCDSVDQAGDKVMGKWEHTAGDYYGGEEAAAKGIMTTEDMRHYFLSSKFDAIDNKGTDLVIQYSLKYTKTPECGGSYIKLLGADADPVRELHASRSTPNFKGPSVSLAVVMANCHSDLLIYSRSW